MSLFHRTHHPSHYPRVLSIAGSDSGGGAGIQADLKTCSALGCYGMTAITAITAQNTQGVRGIVATAPDMIALQIEVVAQDIGVDAVKIGMLHNPEAVRVVAQAIRQFGFKHVVLDPVMIASSGDALMSDEAVEVMVKELFPLVTLITPNLDEVAALLNVDPKLQPFLNAPEAYESFARALHDLGAPAVLIKGGHAMGDTLTDWLLYPDELAVDEQVLQHQLLVEATSSGNDGLSEAILSAVYDPTPETVADKGEQSSPLLSTHFSSKRIDTRNTHGTGCTLSSAIACFLALGHTLPKAVELAHQYVYQAIKHGAEVTTGHGHGPLNHGHAPMVMHILND